MGILINQIYSYIFKSKFKGIIRSFKIMMRCRTVLHYMITSLLYTI